MHLNGNKEMSVDLADFKLMVNAGPLFAVLAVVAMDDP
jgi:vacuolar protein sorting-associated protein 13A/C